MEQTAKANGTSKAGRKRKKNQEYAEEGERLDIRRFKSLGYEHTFGMRTEKYVSVNMIKRILDRNSIYTEDIVDEVFRYLGENIVNKNYFAQIIGVFFFNFFWYYKC